MQAIETKYLGPTNVRGARIVARAQAGRITVPYDHALNFDENHIEAARIYAKRKGWIGSWYSGGAVDGATFVHVPSDGGPAFTLRASYTAQKGDTVRLVTGGGMTGIVRRVDARSALPVTVEWANGTHGPTSHDSLRKVTR
jgi:hypothetical protein